MSFRVAALLTLVGALALAGAPARAGSVDLYGSHWNTADAEQSFGGGLTWASGSRSPLALELRGTYYEQLSNEPLDNLFDSDPVFRKGLKALPLESGLRVRFTRPDAVVRPYLSGGAGYYVLDSDFGNVDDELGWYAAGGSSFGNGRGADFFAEVAYRRVEATVEVDRDSLGDLLNLSFDRDVEVDLSGVGVNLGLGWRW